MPLVPTHAPPTGKKICRLLQGLRRRSGRRSLVILSVWELVDLQPGKRKMAAQPLESAEAQAFVRGVGRDSQVRKRPAQRRVPDHVLRDAAGIGNHLIRSRIPGEEVPKDSFHPMVDGCNPVQQAPARHQHVAPVTFPVLDGPDLGDIVHPEAFQSLQECGVNLSIRLQPHDLAGDVVVMSVADFQQLAGLPDAPANGTAANVAACHQGVTPVNAPRATIAQAVNDDAYIGFSCTEHPVVERVRKVVADEPAVGHLKEMAHGLVQRNSW